MTVNQSMQLLLERTLTPKWDSEISKVHSTWTTGLIESVSTFARRNQDLSKKLVSLYLTLTETT